MKKAKTRLSNYSWHETLLPDRGLALSQSAQGQLVRGFLAGFLASCSKPFTT